MLNLVTLAAIDCVARQVIRRHPGIPYVIRHNSIELRTDDGVPEVHGGLYVMWIRFGKPLEKEMTCF